MTTPPRKDSVAPKSNTRAYHRPNTATAEPHVYILTLTLTPSISVPMNQLRTQWFPKHLNRTPAHITLFHALPLSQLNSMTSDLNAIASVTRPYHVSTGRPFRMRRGVGVRLASGCEASEQLREELRERWERHLSAQDREAWVPHWTVMNKVDEEREVERAFGTIRRSLCEEVQHGRAVGVTLWEYLPGGRWEEVRGWEFTRGRSPVAEREREVGEGRKGKPRSPEVERLKSKVVGVWKAVKGMKGKREGEGKTIDEVRKETVVG